MTDNEIIKALECCTKSGCLICPLYTLEHTGTCVKRTMFGTIDLIKRQKAEIETLKAERNNYKEWYFDTVEQLKTAKSEAIKEFAERMKKYAGAYEFDEYGINSDAFIEVDYVDKLVKEMTEGKEDA